MKKIKEMALEEYLKNISEEELETIYEDIALINLKQHKKKKKKTKIEQIIITIPISFMNYTICTTDEEMNQLNKIMTNEEIDTIDSTILDRHYVFLIDNTYIIPKELKEIYQNINEKQFQNQKKELVTFFYLMVNGVLEINKLIQLVKITGVTLTKEEIIESAKKNYFIIEDELIYFNERAKLLDETNHIHEEKKKNTYKEFTFEEIYRNNFEIEQANYNENISKILAKKIKNKNKRIKITDNIMDILLIGYEFEDEINKCLREENVILNERDEQELLYYANEYHFLYPTWELNGYAAIEIHDDEFNDLELDEDLELDNISFEDLPNQEKIETYIFAYLKINGIMDIDKLLEILNYNHNLNLTRKKLIKESSKISGLNIFENKFLCLNGIENIIIKLLPMKNAMNNYKIIDNMEEMLDELYFIVESIENLGYEYHLKKETNDGLEDLMYMGILNEEILQEVLKHDGYKFTSKQQKELYKELALINKHVRLWELNGFKKSEFTNLNKKDNTNK